MAQLMRIELLILDDDRDPLEVAELIKVGFPEESMKVEIRHFDHRVPYKKAWYTVAEVCDMCGDLVDLRDDPIFRKHNEVNYERHIALGTLG